MADGTDRSSAAWKQFLIGKQIMLAEYDQALVHAKSQVVATHHGVVGEAAVRSWLETFLPGRYGVTAGYVRSQGFETAHQSSHFDVIIYDRLEAPILWIEGNKDKADAGRTRIVPAEHVRAIIEVKAAFNPAAVRDAAAKLAELAPLMAGIDSPGERYPKYLPASAVTAMLFFELRRDDRGKSGCLETIAALELQRPFYGAVVLRGEGLHPDDTALISRYQSDQEIPALWTDAGLLNSTAMSATTLLSGRHTGAMLMWADVNFSRFAFDLLALLNGTYRSGFSSSLHGLDFKPLIKKG